jgi:hypothetical protein
MKVAAIAFGGLVPLLFTSPLADATAAVAATSRASSIAQRRFPRILQESVCNATASRDFIIQSLGPSAANDSLYQNVHFDFVTIPDDPFGLYYLFVDIGSLADSLVTFQLLTEGFVQEDQYFGHNGEYTQEILAQNQLLTKFWKVEGPPVLVAGLHSEPLQLENLTEIALGFWTSTQVNFTTSSITDAEIFAVAGSVRQAIETELPNAYANSALTYNAYSVPQFGAKGFENSSVVVIGDGFMDFFASLGLGAVGNDILHAHEFSHALQFILDLEDAGGDYAAYFEKYNSTRSPETDRQSELEADAMAAYVLAHDQGRNFSVALLVEVTNATFAIGDCDTNDLDHHGTPKQRQCATLWGADEGLDMTGDPVSIRQFRELFVQNLNLILALDPSACTLTDDSLASAPSSSASSPTSPASSPVASPPDQAGGTSNDTSGAGSHKTAHFLAVLAATVWAVFL